MIYIKPTLADCVSCVYFSEYEQQLAEQQSELTHMRTYLAESDSLSQSTDTLRKKITNLKDHIEASSFCTMPPLPSARQHPSYGDCLEVKREYYRNCSVLGCVTQCSQSAAHSCEQFLQVQQIGFVTLGPLRHA